MPFCSAWSRFEAATAGSGLAWTAYSSIAYGISAWAPSPSATMTSWTLRMPAACNSRLTLRRIESPSSWYCSRRALSTAATASIGSHTRVWALAPMSCSTMTSTPWRTAATACSDSSATRWRIVDVGG